MPHTNRVRIRRVPMQGGPRRPVMHRNTRPLRAIRGSVQRPGRVREAKPGLFSSGKGHS